jgi:hypothetical protein
MSEHQPEQDQPRDEEREWVELARWSMMDADLEGLSLDTLALLPFADSPTIPSPATGRPIAVPHGSLLAYARHLLDQWGVPDAHFILRFGQSFGSGTSSEEALTSPGQTVSAEELERLRAEGKVLSLNDPEVQRAIAEGRTVIG